MGFCIKVPPLSLRCQLPPSGVRCCHSYSMPCNQLQMGCSRWCSQMRYPTAFHRKQLTRFGNGLHLLQLVARGPRLFEVGTLVGRSLDADFAGRISGRNDRLRQKMRQEGLDALIVFSDEYRSGHGTYLTGYKPINVIEKSPQVVMYVGMSRRSCCLGAEPLRRKGRHLDQGCPALSPRTRGHPRGLPSAEGAQGADRTDRG